MISSYISGSTEPKKMKIGGVNILLALSLFMSQFYIWSSGLPQFSHIFIILAFILLAFKNKVIKVSRAKILFVFIFYAILVNLFWFFVNGLDTSYLMSIAYWVFNFVFFLLLVNLKDKYIEVFLKLLLKVIFISYLLEILLFFLGLGRYDFYPRYNGFFNDPNQMAFWVLATSSIYLYVSDKKINNIIVYVLGLFLILMTLSRSATLGYPFLALALVIKQKGSILNKSLLIVLSLLALLAVVFVLYNYGIFDDIILRLTEGLEEKETQAEGRGFEALIEFPEYLLFGAGQGNYGLFIQSGHEIHSTWFGILFYYGVFGLSLFLFFLNTIFRKLSLADKILFISPMLYGFTTYSARTIIFWFMISVFVIVRKSSTTMDR